MTSSLQNSLLHWFEKTKRPLPWRATYEPYQVWISEIMLQQTQVSTVLPYFERWMHSFPGISDLASADEEKILKLWEGLGYYSRARNLKKAAQKITEAHSGIFPSRYEDILELPGVGPYTAGAIASIAFQQDLPVVDGNVIRVISRLDDFREEVKGNSAYFWNRARELLPPGQARDFNQGLMELGALVCTPQKPKCSLCPLQSLCKGFKAKTVSFLPFKGARNSKIEIKVAVGILEKDGRIFIQKRAGKGLMAGLWEFPGGKMEGTETLEATLIREIREETGLEIQNIRPFMTLKHAYTRFLVDLHCFLAEPLPGSVTLSSASEFQWIEAEKIRTLPFPAANVKIIEKYLS